MKTRTLTISILLLAIVLAPLAMAEEPVRRGSRGGQGGRERGDFQGRPGGYGGFGSQADGFRGGPGMGGGLDGLLLGRLAERLELTEEQRAEIKAITEGTRPEAEEARKAVGEAMKALHEATDGGTEAEIIAAGKAVGDTFTQQALLRATTTKQIKEVLTAEQLAKLEELKAQMKERMLQQRKDGDGPRRPSGKGGKEGRDGQRRRQRPEQD
jgi:Spy/CpxP family protein refolding chaperone